MEHRFTYIKRWWHSRFRIAYAAALAGVLLLFIAWSSDLNRASDLRQPSNDAGERTTPDYRQSYIDSERLAAGTDLPYLIFDTVHHELRLKIRGAVVWNAPFHITADDSLQLRSFVDQCTIAGTVPNRSVSYVHLFRSRPAFPDSTLIIIADAVSMPAEALQRFIPAHISLSLGNGFYLHIHAEVDSTAGPVLHNGFEYVREFLGKALGGADLTIHVEPAAAQTIYGACTRGTSVFFII